MIEKPDTKILLKKSIMELMKKKPLGKITVSDITKNCMMRRESFYYHFTDKYDLIYWIYESEVYDRLVSDYKGPGSWDYIVKRCIDYVEFFKENPKFVVRALSDFTPNGFHHTLVDCTVRMISSHAKHHLKTDDLSKEMQYYINYYANGNVGLCEEWIRMGMPESENFIANVMANAIPGELKKVYLCD